MRKRLILSLIGLLGLAGASPLLAQQWYPATQPSYLAAPPAYPAYAEYRVAAATRQPAVGEVESYPAPSYDSHPQPQPVVAAYDSCGTSCDGGYGGGYLGGHCCYDSCNAVAWFSADYLFMNRANGFTHARNVINGPDAYSPKDLNFDYASGFRLRSGFAWNCWMVDATYWQVNNWFTESAGDLTNGVAFDGGIGPGQAWEGANYINGGTYFAPIHYAASSPGEADEFEGLGPNATFAGDTPPVYTSEYWSGIKVFDIFLKPRCYSNGCTGYRWGVGYSNIQWDERSRETLQGTLRAEDVGAGPFNNGLGHNALVDPTYGGLTLEAGPANGFDDENGPGGADTLALFHQADTRNSLNGFQLLFDMRLLNWCRVLLDGYVKGGVYDNYARGTIVEYYNEISADNSIYGRRLTDSCHTVAYSSSIGFNTALGLTHWLALRSGYEVMYVSGLALSPEQIDGVSGNQYRIKTDGHALLHGGWLGLEAIY